MQKAAFSIVKYHFDKVTINLSNHKSNEISLNFDTKGVYDKETSSYELCFSVKAFNENHIENPFVEVECIGFFSFENVNSFDEIPDFFYRNCIAILFPFVRAYVSMITVQANVPGIMLPTLNLTSLEVTLKQNTIQK
jgi:preprotein translocase subunit SecB